MTLWKITDDGPSKVKETKFKKEKFLEEHLEDRISKYSSNYNILHKKKRRGIILFTMVGLIIIMLPSTAFSNLISNNGFEFPDISDSYVRYDEGVNLPPNGFGWNITFPYVDQINSLWSGVSGTINPDGYDQSIRLIAFGTLYQTFSTIPGQTYQMSFYYSHAPYVGDEIAGAAGFVALLNGNGPYYYNDYLGPDIILSDHIIHSESTSPDNMHWTQYKVTFKAVSEATTLAFQTDEAYNSCGGCEMGFAGFLVDNVKINSDSMLPNNSAGRLSQILLLLLYP